MLQTKDAFLVKILFKMSFVYIDLPPPVHIQSGGDRREEIQTKIGMGMCKWCRIFTTLQDFTSMLDGREIYCTGLCSEKCFIEAAKQINTMEGSSSKSRYLKYSSQSKSTSSQCDDMPSHSSSSNRYSSSSSHSPLVNEQPRGNNKGMFCFFVVLTVQKFFNFC